MTPEIIRYRAPLDQSDGSSKAYAKAGEVLKESPHCLGFQLLRSARDAELFLLTIQWDSPEGHMAGFRRSPQFAKFFALIGRYVSNILEMEHYRATDVHWQRLESI
jgi:quinol monooxygenase YgiN